MEIVFINYLEFDWDKVLPCCSGQSETHQKPRPTLNLWRSFWFCIPSTGIQESTTMLGNWLDQSLKDWNSSEVFKFA